MVSSCRSFLLAGRANSATNSLSSLLSVLGLQIYGHQKFKTGAIRSYGNVIAYASEFGGKWKTPGTIADEPNAMFDNQVWFVDNAK